MNAQEIREKSCGVRHIYRPRCGAAFGAGDTQAADCAACKHFGPLCGKL